MFTNCSYPNLSRGEINWPFHHPSTHTKGRTQDFFKVGFEFVSWGSVWSILEKTRIIHLSYTRIVLRNSGFCRAKLQFFLQHQRNVGIGTKVKISLSRFKSTRKSRLYVIKRYDILMQTSYMYNTALSSHVKLCRSDHVLNFYKH